MVLVEEDQLRLSWVRYKVVLLLVSFNQLSVVDTKAALISHAEHEEHIVGGSVPEHLVPQLLQIDVLQLVFTEIHGFQSLLPLLVNQLDALLGLLLEVGHELVSRHLITSLDLRQTKYQSLSLDSWDVREDVLLILLGEVAHHKLYLQLVWDGHTVSSESGLDLVEDATHRFDGFSANSSTCLVLVCVPQLSHVVFVGVS